MVEDTPLDRCVAFALNNGRQGGMGAILAQIELQGLRAKATAQATLVEELKLAAKSVFDEKYRSMGEYGRGEMAARMYFARNLLAKHFPDNR